MARFPAPRPGNGPFASRDNSVAKRRIILEQSLAHEPDQVEAEPPVLMVELQDLVDGHHAEIDLSLADRRVHPLDGFVVGCTLGCD